MRKKFIAGAAVLALLMNAPQVSADDDVVIFGGEFEDTPSAQKKSDKKIDKPEPKKPVEKPVPTKPKVEEPQNKTPTKPIKESPKPEIVEPQDKPPTQPVKESPKPEIVEPQDKPPTQPLEQPPAEYNRPFENPTNISGEQKPVETERQYFPSRNAAQKSKELKTLKPRFIKLAVDDTYTYYLDKNSVQWKRVPYLANEYMADVWVRMVEREPARLDNDMENYGAENFKAEVALAREQGYQYSPEDLQILRRQNYILEHYYLRPKTKQIQFLCELEVFGRPQNAINERAYDNRNWENLVPGSVESAIYNATIKIIGKSKSTERGHMTFVDMLDEYARIALN